MKIQPGGQGTCALAAAPGQCQLQSSGARAGLRAQHTNSMAEEPELSDARAFSCIGNPNSVAIFT